MSKEKNEDSMWDLLILAILVIVVLSAIMESKKITYYSKVEDNKFEVCTLTIVTDKSVCAIEDELVSVVSIKKENVREFLRNWNNKSIFYRLWNRPSQLALELSKEEKLF